MQVIQTTSSGESRFLYGSSKLGIFLSGLAEDFLYSGTSALLLLIANLFPGYWYLSFIALLPLLWQLNRVNLRRSVVLGILLASCYSLVAFISELLFSPWTFFHKLFLLSLTFSVFSIAVNRIKRYVGFNPILIATFWFALEYILTHYPSLGSILILPNSDSGFMIRFSSLFGFLMVSFGIVLINSIILMFIEYVEGKVLNKSICPVGKEKDVYTRINEAIIIRNWNFLLIPRGPPIKEIPQSY